MCIYVHHITKRIRFALSITTKTKKMVRIQILKNGEIIKVFTCPKTQKQKYFNHAQNIAGGMYDGINLFTIKIVAL